jgi:site-specific recombinase XerD
MSSSAHITLSQAVEAYLKEISQARAESVVANHTSVSRRFLEYFPDRRSIDSLGKEDLEAFLKWTTHRRGSFTPHTHNLALEFLKRLWRFCFVREWVEEDPAGEIPYIEIETPVPTILTREEMVLLKETAQEEDLHLVLVGLLGELGLKKKELMALRFADLELDDPEPTVAIRYTGKLQRKSRRLPLSKDLVNALRRYRSQRQGEGDFTFLAPLVQITGRQVNNILAGLCKKAGARRANPQILRDTAGAHLLTQGRPPEEVARTLGYTPRGYLLEFLPRFQMWIEPLPE